MPELVPVRVRDCACPDSPHEDGDIVYLAPVLGYKGGLAAERQLFALSTNEDALTEAWGETFIRYGATAWNLTDEAGDDVPFDVEAVLADFSLARPIVSKAIDLYGEAVLVPFVPKSAKPSPTGRTGRTTSRRSTQKTSLQS